MNPNKEGTEGDLGKDEMNFIPDADFLEDLKKEMGIPEEDLIKKQLENNKIQEETPSKSEDKNIQEESQEGEKKDK